VHSGDVLCVSARGDGWTLFAWMHNFRRLVTRWEYRIEHFPGFVQLACIHTMLKRL
jgi:hypothetical protein